MKGKTIAFLFAGILIAANSTLIKASDLETIDEQNDSVETVNESSDTETFLEQDATFKEAESTNNIENTIVSGKCGDNVNYELNLSTGVMRIYGSGEMDDYSFMDRGSLIRAPWIREEHDSSIISIKIEQGVTHIGDFAFYRGYTKKYCENIESVEIAETVETIGESAFLGCDKLSSIKGAKGVRCIGIEAFSATALNEFPWGDSLECIEDSAFSSTNFTEITIPSSVQVIGKRAFQGCKNLKTLSGLDNCEIKSYAFADCSILENAAIGDKCKIRGGMFTGCSALKNVSIGEGSVCVSVDKEDIIVGHVFKDCTSLQTIILPDSWRFYDDNIEETKAYMYQFCGCTQLRDIQFHDTNSRYKVIDNIVYSKDGSTIVYYPVSLTAAEYEIPKHTTKIGACAFYSNKNLEYIFIPSSVKDIRFRAFGECDKLENVIIPEGIAELGIGIFSGCKNLNAVVIPESVKKIDINYKTPTATFAGAGLNVVYGENGSYAQEFAGQTGYKFENIIYCSFDENGGYISEKKKPVIYNDQYHKLPTPTREGYKFQGWYTEKEAGENVESETIVSAKTSHVLYAHWEKECLKGDVNGDGTINILDLQIILRNICGKIDLTEQQIILADVVVDGVIDIQDLRLELRFVCGKIDKL